MRTCAGLCCCRGTQATSVLRREGGRCTSSTADAPEITFSTVPSDWHHMVSETQFLPGLLHTSTAACMQHNRCRSSSSHPAAVKFGVPQSSVLGPILFLLYTADLLRLVELHNLCPYLYADDTQIHGFWRHDATTQLHDRMTACVGDVALYMQ